MILELLNKLHKHDEDFTIEVGINNGVYQISVNWGLAGEMYSYGSTDLLDVYTHVNQYIEALSDIDKFEDLYGSILTEPLEA